MISSRGEIFCGQDFAIPASLRVLYFVIERVHRQSKVSNDRQPPLMRHRIALTPLLKRLFCCAEIAARLADRGPIQCFLHRAYLFRRFVGLSTTFYRTTYSSKIS